MTQQQKEQRLTGYDTSLAEVGGDQMDASLAETAAASAGDLSVDLLANILGCLHVEDIMRSRGVNEKWKEAVKMTIVPLNADVFVDGLESYNAMRVMTRAMPNLQQITLRDFEDERDESESDEYDSDSESDEVDPDNRRLKWSDGEEPHRQQAAATADWTTHDIGIISHFSKLQIFTIYEAPMNGRYPVLFNFPLLQKLSIQWCRFLKWDLGVLAGLPLLKELECSYNSCMTGNTNSLRVLKNKLEKVRIGCCDTVEGNFMDLADFPNLKKLELFSTAVTGDIRDIGRNDFALLEELDLPKGVYGGDENEVQRIADGPDVVRAVYLLKKQRPTLTIPETWHVVLSEDSPDWYEPEDEDEETPPFYIHFVKAGSRVGYRWQTRYYGGYPCEVNWLDPEPDSESSDYEEYIAKLQEINREVDFYKGFHQPPTEEEYNRYFLINTV